MKTTAFIEIGKDMTYDIHSTDDRLDFMVLGQGKTITEAKKDFYRCLEEIKELYIEEGKPFDFDDLTFQFKYDIASFLKYSPFTLTWLSYVTGINKKQLSHYSTGVRHPSKPTLEKIQDAVITFAKDYEQVSFVELG
ncbi:MAG: DNA-binding protein [Bacteroidales bacterium]|nr:DNA-binding protein [Bacteroidales bacterium]